MTIWHADADIGWAFPCLNCVNGRLIRGLPAACEETEEGAALLHVRRLTAAFQLLGADVLASGLFLSVVRASLSLGTYMLPSLQAVKYYVALRMVLIASRGICCYRMPWLSLRWPSAHAFN